MKVYVDGDLPDNCKDCNFAVSDRFATYCPFCKHKNGDHKNVTLIEVCPLQNISDYTKEVRKEACEKFVEQFMLEYTMGNEPVEDIIYKVANQIQGESDAKD